jgi:outer membrane murein-binding lipoprotein Lpp
MCTSQQLSAIRGEVMHTVNNEGRAMSPIHPKFQSLWRQLLIGTAPAALLFAIHPAAAETAQTPSSIAQLNSQVQVLQQQMQQLQDQIKAAQSQLSAQQAQQAQQAQVTPPPPAAPPGIGGIQIGGVNLKFGGFAETAGIYRSRNEVADVGSDFNGIPFKNNPRNHESELRFSARQSRISGLVSGDVDKNTHLSAYAEADFLGASDVSNARESNSFLLRMRHFYGTVDNDASGGHFLAGQTWSLLTTNTKGIIPRNEQIPLTIDAQYVTGFNWLRVPQARYAQDFGSGIWAGLSVESPQALVGGNNPGGTTFANNQANPNANNPGDGTGLFSANQNFTTDTYPDIVGKIAFDPGFGHYELKGAARFFTDRFNGSNHTNIGGGIGGAASLPVVPQLLDFQLSGLAGYGIGRYGSAQINDVSFATNGSLKPTPEFEALLGLIAHPMPGTDIYLYGGIEQVDRTATSSGVGFGSSTLNNTTCNTETAVVGSASTVPACPANTHRVAQVTLGFWQDLYKGTFGRVAVGAQGGYLKKFTFSASGGGQTTAPNVDEAIVMTSFRYYPF